MKRYLTLIALVAAVLTTQAQDLFFKVGGGLSSHYSDAKAVGAFKIGVGCEYEFDQHWSVAPSLYVYGKGWKDKDFLTQVVDDDTRLPEVDDNGQPVWSLTSRSSTVNYIQLAVPFNYYLRVGEGRYVVFALGPYAAYGVSGKVKVKGDGTQIGERKMYYDYKTFSVDGHHRFDAGVQASAGFQFASGITVGLEGDFGLTRFSTDGARNISGLVTFSYRFQRIERRRPEPPTTYTIKRYGEDEIPKREDEK